ncbi:MAG: efflux RND transporter permease subunit, partial [Paraburkholderia sp.]
MPILELGLSGQGISEQALNDYGLMTIRPQLVTVQGAAVPYPYGGKQRQVQVDLNTQALQAKGLSPLDVVNAIAAQNLILPTGTSKIGLKEYDVDIANAAPETIAQLNRIPVKTIGSTTIYISDVAWVRDGFPPQTNIVRVNGERSSLLTVQKNGNTSTLSIISGINALLPFIKTLVPPALQIKPLADQSIFVKGAIKGVVTEASIAACLTGIMILVFLGSWRSTTIIVVSIPLAILTSIITFSALGETINMMTLGGLALAVGILVDDATVEIENINRNRQAEPNKDMDTVVLDSAAQIATPAFVATISICIVFTPMFLLSGVAKFLFVPLGEAVIFAMLASYLLSRTIVPMMAKYLLRYDTPNTAQSRNPFVRMQVRFEEAFERLRGRYHGVLEGCLHHRGIFLIAFFSACVGSLVLIVPWLGQDFFPTIDSGSFNLHMRAPTGLRIEETARLCDLVERFIRQQLPPGEISNIIDNIGLPYSGINTSYLNTGTVGTSDADILVTFGVNNHHTAKYIHDLRISLAKEFPGVTFSFLPSDMVTQILNFGLPAPIDIQVVGTDLEGNQAFANNLLNQVKFVSGIADARIQQPFDEPY